MGNDSLYKVIFLNQGEVWEVYARQVGQGVLFGFVEVEELCFGERSRVVIDPSEEKIKSELEGVRRTHIPLHSVIRIDEVDREGSARIREGSSEGSKVAPFPVPMGPRPDEG
ncbi:MAG: DUF1820 family protein [Thermoanaerobaculia bacterium]|nr:DUF1820 family protein [Thermoanaerobaculia bacterium]